MELFCVHCFGLASSHIFCFLLFLFCRGPICHHVDSWEWDPAYSSISIKILCRLRLDKGFLYLSFFFFFKQIGITLLVSILLFSFRNTQDKNSCLGILSSVIHNHQKVKAPKCPSADEWVNITWYTIEHYSATKRNEELIHNTGASETLCWLKSQTWKVMYCMISFAWNIQNRLTHRNRKQSKGCQQLGAGWDEEWLVEWVGVSFFGGRWKCLKTT